MIPDFSGIVFSNNTLATGSVSSGTIYQTFNLPSDYIRGLETEYPVVPYFTGIQVCITATQADIILPWTIQHQNSSGSWDIIANGLVTQSAIVGEQYWINIFSDDLITIESAWVNDLFRFSLGIDGITVTNIYYTEPNPLSTQNLEAYVKVNLVPNPSFAHDVVGQPPTSWVANSATLSVTSTPSLQITTTAVSDGVDTSIPLTGEFFEGFQYTLSYKIKGQSGGEAVTVSIGNGSTDTAQEVLTLTTSYTLQSIIWTPKQNYSSIYLSMTNTGSGAETFFLQDVMVTPGTSTTYVDGDTSGYSWIGTPGNSSTIETYGSLLFNLTALVADSGFDILGNSYRSNVVPHLVGNVNTESALGESELTWISRPNPSPQAIECIYVDISDSSGSPTVIDSILMDPVTQGVNVNVYFSSDGEPVVDASDWDNKLWTHVPREFVLTKRDTYILPRAVTANYIKLEFSNLQGQNYNPGGSPLVTYNKFPSWVFYYFLLQVMPPRLGEDYFIGDTETVVFDYLDFAYNYYTGQAIQTAQLPAPVVADIQAQINQINVNPPNLDTTTLGQINSNLVPYQSQPVLSAPNDYLPAVSASDLGGTSNTLNYSTEGPFPSFAAQPLTNNGNYVSTRIKDSLVQETTLPQMYFWQICRHSYKQVQASFLNNTAYYAGIRNLAFLRQDFTVPVDTPVYYETFGDSFNQIGG